MELRLRSALLLLSLFTVAVSSSSSSSKRDTCQSIECVALSAEIASRMNGSADPCEDFYNFACGNFPNVVKYNPLKGGNMRFDENLDTLLEDTIGLMSEKVERNIYEMLVLDRVVTSRDADMLGLYNFTRLFYRSCRRWIPMFSSSNVGQQSEPRIRWLAMYFIRAVYKHLEQVVKGTSGGFASFESTLAALVKSGGIGLVSVKLPRQFVEKVISNNDPNLTQTERAVVRIPMEHLVSKQVNFSKAFDFLEKADIGSPRLKFSKKYDIFKAIYSELSSIITNPQKSTNCTMNRTVVAVAEMDRLAACLSPSNPFSWTRFFDELLQSRVDPAALVEIPNPVMVMEVVGLFKSRWNISSAAASQGNNLLSDSASFLVFDWLLSFSIFFPVEAQETWLMTKPQVIDPNEIQDSSACMMLTKKLLQPLVERMYSKAYHRDDFGDIKRLIQLVKNASIANVQRQSWITPSAKTSIVRKIQSMRQSIGLDDLTAGQLKSFYNDTLAEFRSLKLDTGKLEINFGSLLVLAVCAYARKNLDIMSGGSPVSLFMVANPLEVNAFNWISRNQIIFPMAILAPPIYHPNYPEYINLGSIGYIIGHEIGHSFDDTGHTINQMGAIGHFWDNTTEERYLERMECVRNRFGSYSLFPGGPKHQSNTTVGNDIADIMGITAATEALRILQRGSRRRPMPRMPNLHADFSPEQMLFIQAAQCWCIKSEPYVLKGIFGGYPSHSPHHLRIRGIAENSPEFAAAFKCRSGKPMNPKNKCSFW